MRCDHCFMLLPGWRSCSADFCASWNADPMSQSWNASGGHVWSTKISFAKLYRAWARIRATPPRMRSPSTSSLPSLFPSLLPLFRAYLALYSRILFVNAVLYHFTPAHHARSISFSMTRDPSRAAASVWSPSSPWVRHPMVESHCVPLSRTSPTFPSPVRIIIFPLSLLSDPSDLKMHHILAAQCHALTRCSRRKHRHIYNRIPRSIYSWILQRQV